MPATITKPTIKIPLDTIKLLSTNPHTKKIMCEFDIAALKKVNRPAIIDFMVAEAKAEYKAGKTKKFTNVDDLMKYLNA